MPLSDPTYQRLKRLQVWTGALPVGLFLLSHLATNARSIAGAEVFDRAAHAIWRLPFLVAFEIVLIALPMLLHVGLGILLGLSPQAAGDARGYPRPGLLLAQRASGFFLVVYVVFHVSATRLSLARLSGDTHLFDMTARTLGHPFMFGFHAAGVLAAAFHFGNGLPALAGPWGLDRGARGQAQAQRIGLAATIVLSLVGLWSLLAFVHPAFRFLAPRMAVAP
jgi:succinate dehydrogenase / fumarate reductase cytochrome b subunit